MARGSAWAFPVQLAPGVTARAVGCGADWTNTVHGLAEQTEDELAATGQTTPALAGGPGRVAVARAAAGRATSVA